MQRKFEKNGKWKNGTLNNGKNGTLWKNGKHEQLKHGTFWKNGNNAKLKHGKFGKWKTMVNLVNPWLTREIIFNFGQQ